MPWPCYLRECIASEWSPDDICAQFWPDTDRNKVQVQTYAQFQSVSDELASVLREHYKRFNGSDGSDQLVAIQYRPHLLVSALVYGVVKSNAAFFPVSHTSDLRLFKHHLCAIICLLPEYQLSHTDLSHYKVYCGNSDLFQRPDWCLLLRLPNDTSPLAVPTPIRPSTFHTRLAYVIRTSGSSGGVRKVVFVADSCLSANIVDLQQRFSINSDSPSHAGTVLLASPLTFDASIVQIFFALATHRCLIIPGHVMLTCPGKLRELCVDAKIAWLQCTPSQLLLHPLDDQLHLFANPELHILLGGEPFPDRLLRLAKRKSTKAAVYGIYGVTEVSSWASICRINQNSVGVMDEKIYCDCIAPAPGATPLGFPMLATLMNLSDGVPSILMVQRECGGYFILRQTKSYISLEDFTSALAALSTQQSWITGDLSVYGSCGRCLWFTGREDRVVKRWGHQISLERLEHCISQCILPGVKIQSCHCELRDTLALLPVLEASIVITTHAHLRWRLRHSVVQSRSRWRNCLLTHLQRCFQPNPTPWLPVRIRFRSIISSTLSGHGKTLHRSTKATRRRVPRSLTLKQLTYNAWREAIGFYNTQGIMGRDSFLSLGGSSLTAVYLTETLIQCMPLLQSVRPELLNALFSLNFEQFVQFIRNAISLSRSVSSSPPMKQNIEITPTSGVPFSHMCNPKNKFTSYTKGAIVSSTLNLSSEFRLIPRWTRPLGKCVDASALIITSTSTEMNPLVCVGSHSGLFTATNLNTGNPCWSNPVGARIEAAAVLADSLVAVGTLDGTLCLIDLITGTPIQTVTIGGAIKCPATHIPDHRILVIGSHGRRVCGLDPRSNSPIIWSNPVDNSPIVAPACHNTYEQVFVATLGGSVGCLDLRKPEVLLWQSSGWEPLFSGVQCLPQSSGMEEDSVCAASVDGTVMSFMALTGSQQWTRRLTHSNSPVNLFHDLVPRFATMDFMISTASGSVYTLDWVTGRMKWKLDCTTDGFTGTLRQLCTPCQIDAGGTKHIVVTRADGHILVGVGDTMSPIVHPAKTRHILPTSSFSAPVVFVDPESQQISLVCGCRDDNLYCFDLVGASD